MYTYYGRVGAIPTESTNSLILCITDNMRSRFHTGYFCGGGGGGETLRNFKVVYSIPLHFL